METLLPEEVVSQMTQMIEVEQKVLYRHLTDCSDMPVILVKNIFQRLGNNALTLGNLALVLSAMREEREAEIQFVEDLLAEEEDQ